MPGGRAHAYAQLITTHYERLGLEPDATPQQIKQAYRTLARMMHPDVAGTDEVRRADAMSELNEAFRILRDPERRRRYDASLRGEVLAPETPAGEVAERPDWLVDESPEPMVFTRLPKVFVVGVLGAALFILFIISLFAFRSDDPINSVDPVDGVVSVGSCVAVGNVGGQVGETSCNGAEDGTVMALVGFDQDCPTGTFTFQSESVSTKVCVKPRSG
ncbi:MAG: J domain-containing protein [Acidimicrobiia bacterium]